MENDPTFNIVAFVEWLAFGHDDGNFKFRSFEIRFFDMQEGEKPAYVTYRPMVLHVDREVWDLARDGDPTSRYILAHEICHLYLHDHHATSFSNDPALQTKVVSKEQSAEWQANTFANHLLLPEHIVVAYQGDLHLARACQAPREIAAKLLNNLRRSKGPRYLGDCCPNTDCGNFTVTVRDGRFKCDTCGYDKGIFQAT